MATKIITIANQKGGVGKTTTAITLAHGLARAGASALVLDFDPQGQVASSLGLNQGLEAYYLLTMGRKSPPEITFLKQLVRFSGRENLWLIPGNRDVVAAQNDLVIRERPITYIRQAVEIYTRPGNGQPDPARLDYILIDTSPSVGGLQERALWAADFVIIPTAMEYLSNAGVVHLIQTLQVLYREKDWAGRLLGVLPTFYDNQTRQSQQSLHNLQQAFAEHVLPPIHRATVLREASAEGRTIFEKDPHSRAAQEYQTLVKAVLRAR